MEPLGVLHDGVEVVVRGLGVGEGAVGAVVDDQGRALHGTGLQVVDAEAGTLDLVDGGNIDTVAADLAEAGFADRVGRKRGDELRVLAQHGQGDCDVALAAAERGFKGGRLEEALVARGLQAKHDLAERNILTHVILQKILGCDVV